MVVKRICFFLIFLLFSASTEAQDIQVQKVIQPDSLFHSEEDSLDIDSLRLPIIPDSSKIKTYTLKEVEQQVRSIEDTFFNFSNKTFVSNSIYRFGNNFYFPPYEQIDYSIYNLKLNNLFFDSNDIQGLLFYYNLDRKENNEYEFSCLETDFEPTLSAVRFASGSFSLEDRYLNFQKNSFFNFCNAKLFVHSGKDKSPWNNKNYFDNTAFQTEKNFSSYKMTYNFLKLFSKNDRYNFANPINGIEIGDNYSQKRRTIYHILDVSLFENFIDFSYLHQRGYEKIYGDTSIKNNFYRNQINLGFHLPIEEYETDIYLKADINDYNYIDYKGIVKDYYIVLKMNSPGIFYDFYTIKLRNEIYFSGLDDTTYFYPQLIFDIPIIRQFTTNFFIGVKGEQNDFQTFDSGLRHNRIKVVFADLILNYKLNQYDFTLKPFIRQVQNDAQYILLSGNGDAPDYEKIKDYTTYGFTAIGEACFDYFTIHNRLRLNFDFKKRPSTLVYRPNIALKLLWEVRQDLKHNNFIYAKSELSYLKDFRNIELEKEKNEIFLDIKCGININRFRISVLFKNILNQDYFMDEHNLINGYGTYLQVHWNFIN
ncbi:MAG: hypothetical protein U9R23_04300 [Candidatus Cloacimonadota bacterium]|nr:hypothetical protein [Candidatus Cloacimonadota bacterium]